jgi:hypothetical protein
MKREQGVGMRDANWIVLGLEFVIVAVGIVAGFQITEWGERQGSRELAAQNLVRAIAETEYNAERLGRVVEQLERDYVLLESVISGLRECENDVTRNEIEKVLVVLGYDFFPGTESSQVNSLTRVEYTPFYSQAFLTALPAYLAKYTLIVEATLANHDAHFDFQLDPAALDKVTVLEGHPNDEFSKRFYLSAAPGDLCENPEAIKRFWRQTMYRVSNKRYYEYLKQEISGFLSLMRQQLQSI